MLGPKKFKIKKWDNPAKNDPNFQNEAWGIIKDAMDHIFAKKESSLSFEVLYRKAYFLVIHKQGQFLHDGAMARIREHLKSVAATLPPPPMAGLSSTARGEEYVKKYIYILKNNCNFPFACFLISIFFQWHV